MAASTSDKSERLVRASWRASYGHQSSTDDSVSDLASRDFAVTEELTKATQPGIKLL